MDTEIKLTPVQQAIHDKVAEIRRHSEIMDFLVQNTAQLSKLSPTANVNAVGDYSIWLEVNNRDDLSVALALFPGKVWSKRGEGKVMTYSHWIEPTNIKVIIRATESAIPPTCKVTTKTIVIPAQPERTETVQEITCEV